MNDVRVQLDSSNVVIFWGRDTQAKQWMLDTLNEQEFQRIDGIRHQSNRNRFVVGAFLLRMAAGRLLNLAPSRVVVDRICGACSRPHGRPKLVGTDLACSVSHSGNHVVVALSTDGQVGVDVEDVSIPRAFWASVAAAAISEGEEPLRSHTDFLRMWTAKEAVLKLTGEGLARPMSSIELAPMGIDRVGSRHLDWRPVRSPVHLRRVSVATRVCEGAVVSIATSASAIALGVVAWPEMTVKRFVA